MLFPLIRSPRFAVVTLSLLCASAISVPSAGFARSPFATLSAATNYTLTPSEVYAADLDGAHNVPPVSTAAEGIGTFSLNPNSTLTYSLTVAGMNGTAARIRAGLPGLNGAVVATLAGGPTT